MQMPKGLFMAIDFLDELPTTQGERSIIESSKSILVRLRNSRKGRL